MDNNVYLDCGCTFDFVGEDLVDFSLCADHHNFSHVKCLADKTLRPVQTPAMTDSEAAFYASIWQYPEAGAHYSRASSPSLYMQTMRELKGKFTHGELSLMIDVMNGCALTPQLAGQHITADVEDGILLDGLAAKWNVSKDKILATLNKLAAAQRAYLELWARGYWETHPGLSTDGEIQAWLEELL